MVAISRGEVITKRRSFDSDLNYWVTLLYIPTVLRTVGEFRVRIFPMAMEVSAPLFYPLTGSKSAKPVRSDFLKSFDFFFVSLHVLRIKSAVFRLRF